MITLCKHIILTRYKKNHSTYLIKVILNVPDKGYSERT